MSVELDPPELGFKRPFTHEVSQVLRLHNPSSDPVAFKVKTTAPKQYCVRPNSGRIEGNRDVEVQVLLQAMKTDPPAETKCRDKFLVQSVPIPSSAINQQVAEIWEAANKSSIKEMKIRVNFLPSDGDTSSAPTTNGTHDSPPAYASSPASPASMAAVTPQRQSAGAVSKPEDRPSDSKHLGDALSSASNPAVSPSGAYTSTTSTPQTSHTAQNQGGAAGAAASIGLPTSQEELKRQLDEAKATIVRLQGQVSESSGLRQRKADTASLGGEKSASGGQMTQVSGGGVPVMYVALLCLVAFLLAYFLF